MKTIDKLFSIVELLSNQDGLSFSDIVQLSKYDKSVVHRLLVDMIKNKYVFRDSEKKYHLDYKFVNIASRILQRLDIRGIAKPYIAELSASTGQTVHLAMLANGNVVYIDKRDCQHPIRMYSEIGASVPMHCTGLGKLLLAYQDKRSIEAIVDGLVLTPYTATTITERQTLMEELEAIRRKGYAIDRGEHEDLIKCIAAPIMSADGSVRFAISISILEKSKSCERIMEFKHCALETAGKISTALGHV